MRWVASCIGSANQVASRTALIVTIDSVMSANFLSADWVGRVVDGRFTLLRRLGGTQSSVVFLTEIGHEPTRKVAIKFVAADEADAQDRLAQWQRARTLSHAHLSEIVDYGRCEFDGKALLYVVGEYAEEVLSEILPERALTPEEIREMLGPILDALDFLHGRNLVHAHLKPSNILVVGDRLKISADGIVAAGETAGRLPAARQAYDAPEHGTRSIAPAADVWSLGIVLVQAFTQQMPSWHQQQGAEPEVPGTIPEPFYGVARECLRLDPARRLTIASVKAQLNPTQPVAFAQPAEAAAVNPRRPDEPAAESRAKPGFKRNLQATLGTLLILGLALAIMKIEARHRAPAPRSPSSSSVWPSSSVSPGSARGPVAKGEVASRALPEVPAKIAATVRGHVRVSIRVHADAQGVPTDASIDSAGPSRYFARQALEAAQKWKFTPAWVGGRTVESVWILHFEFSSSQTTASAQEVSP
jgi:TonB family protein